MRFIFALLLVGCTASPTIDLIECEEHPEYLWHSDTPWPRGRIHACQTCMGAEKHFHDRGAELGCETEPFPSWACTPSGACDYTSYVDYTTGIELAQSCAELRWLANEDPCIRPRPDLYWRPEGD